MRVPRNRFPLRDAADIDRLLMHVATHWSVPPVDVRIDRLPAQDSHRAQDRLARLSQSCHCVLGETVGGLTLLVGTCLACVWQGWRYFGWTLVAAFGAWLVGKGIELAWHRARLAMVLWRLRQRLAAAVAGRLAEAPAPVIERQTYQHPFNSGDDLLHPDRVQPPRRAARVERPKLLVRDIGDLDRALHHLVTRWTLPHIEIQVDSLPRPAVERAQDRLVRLSSGYSYQLAGVLALPSFVAGMVYAIKPPQEVVMWTLPRDWSVIPLVLVATLGAALLGLAAEVLWTRLRLLRVLRGLRKLMPGSPPHRPRDHQRLQ